MAPSQHKQSRSAAAATATTTRNKTPPSKRGMGEAITKSHVVVDVSERSLWTPTFETAVSLLILPRVISALVNPIADCDETFNYWEPLHYLMYGFGQQTWEYSPAYALRSYLYLAVHYVVAKAAAFGFYLGMLGNSSGAGGGGMALVVPKVMVFFGLRGALALVCSYCEALFYRSCIAHFGRRTARYLLWFLIWNAGIFHASTAFLPSTFVMYLVMLFLSAWMDKQHFLGIFWGIVAVLCGWPYVGVLFVPFMVDTLQSRGVVKSLMVGGGMGLAVLALEMSVNFYFYQKWVLPAWNIVHYNVLSGETDSTLYGTEPWSFYVLNLVLNFNVAFLLAVPVVLTTLLLPPSSSSSSSSSSSASGGAATTTTTTTSTVRRLVFLSPLFLWLGIMFSQAHKEERFLFPVYPLLCLAAAITLSAVVYRLQRIVPSSSSFSSVGQLLVNFIVYGSLISYSALSVARVTSNVINFSAPITVYQHLHDQLLPNPTKSSVFSLQQQQVKVVNLCVGKEWYRFPSSFFLPTNATQLQFIKSSFTGLLPKPFEQHANGTSIIPTEMNNQNREEKTRYFKVDDCDFVVDLNLPNQQETKFWQLPNDWQLVYEVPFMDAENSKSPYRSFYVPLLTPRIVVFAQYAVYKKIAPKTTKEP